MAFDFPSSPTNGQEYTSGSITYVYNGVGWTAKSGDIYSKTESDTRYVNTTGDTMTGALTTITPTLGGHAANRTYVDTTVNTVDTSLNAAKVAKAGDTMTGDLTISKVLPTVKVDKPASGNHARIQGYTAGSSRWAISLGDASPESGGAIGSDFVVYSYDNTGAYLGSPFNINRSTSLVTVPTMNVSTVTASTSPTTGALTVAGGVGVGGHTCAGFGLSVQGQSFPTSGAGIEMSYASNTGLIQVYDRTGAAFKPLTIVSGTPLIVGSGVASTSPTTGALTVAGGVGVGGSVSIGGSIGMGVAPNAAPGLGNTNVGVDIRSDGFISASRSNLAANFNQNSDGTLVIFNRSGVGVGTITVNTTSTAFNTSSDASLKEDLKSFDAGNIIDNTNVYDFAWKSTKERAYGVIAQQAVDVYPLAVTHTEASMEKGAERDEWWGVDYSKYVPVILQELKSLRSRVAELEGKA